MKKLDTAVAGKVRKRMGKVDTRTKRYMSDPKHFADAFNSSVFKGKQIVKADSLSLQEMDSTELGIVITEDAKESVQKIRDILKKSIIMNDGKIAFLMLGIENQSEVHYAMPVRNLIYDALNYGHQVNKIIALHRKTKDIKNRAEYLSGFTKNDKIMPVITLTVYFGAKEWDAPRCLKDMFSEDVNVEILNEIDDYKLHLIVPAEIEDFSVFKTELGIAMKYIAASESPEKIEALSKDTAFEKVSVETVHLINECTGSGIVVPEGEEVINMCKGLEGYGKKEREEGRAEGALTTLVELVQKGLLTIEDAAEQIGITLDEFQQKMNNM